MVVHLSEFAAIQVLDTDIVWAKVSFGPELFPMAVVWFVGVAFGIINEIIFTFTRLFIENFRTFFFLADPAIFLSSNLSHESQYERMCWICVQVTK